MEQKFFSQISDHQQSVVPAHSRGHPHTPCLTFPGLTLLALADLTDEYFELDLPVAPAVMVGDEILVEGTDISEDKLEGAICQHLGIDGPPKKKSILSKIIRK